MRYHNIIILLNILNIYIFLIHNISVILFYLIYFLSDVIYLNNVDTRRKTISKIVIN